MGKFPTDRRADLGYVLGWAEPIESRHQRSLQACRNRDERRWFCCDGAPRFPFTLQYRLGHFLDEQWYAVSAVDNVLADVRAQRSIADDSLNEGIDVAPRQPIERQRAHVRSSDPGRVEFRPESKKYQKPAADGQIH